MIPADNNPPSIQQESIVEKEEGNLLISHRQDFINNKIETGKAAMRKTIIQVPCAIPEKEESWVPQKL